MPVPAFTYVVSDLPGLAGAKNQAVSSGDRPLCALTAALSSYLRGNPLRGQAIGLTEAVLEERFTDAFLAQDVPMDRARQWAEGCAGFRLDHAFETIAGVALDPYQIKAIQQLTTAGGVFALDMGLGKTLTSIAAAVGAVATGHSNSSRCWIVCPLNAMGAWQPYVATLQEHFEEVKILSVDSSHKYHMTTPTGGTLIFDEVHLLGSPRATRTKNCHKLRRLFDFAICNTGTLLHAGVEKCLSIMDLAVPGASALASRWTTGEHFHCLTKNDFGVSLEKPSAKYEVAFAEYLGHVVTILDTDSPSVLESLKVPPQETETVNLSVPWKTLSDAVVEVVEARLAAGEPLPSMPEVAHFISRQGIDAKLAWLEQCMDDTPIVLFAHYTPTMDALANWLTARGTTFARIDGDTPQKDRPAIEADFKAGKFQVLLGQMRAAGVSLNLQRAWISVAVDFSWSAIDYAQAKRRTRRRGQTRECVHYDLVANRLQHNILARLRAGQAFNASVAAYQEMRRALESQ